MRIHKSVHLAVVPALMLWHPVVADVVRARRIHLGCVQMKGHQLSNRRDRGIRRIGLLERRALIRKPAHAAVASKVVIERAVLLRQYHHVFDVSDLGATTRDDWNQLGEPAAALQAQRRKLCKCRRTSDVEPFTATEVWHSYYGLDAT